MSRHGPVPFVVALIAVLLPAGAFAAITVDSGPPARQAARVGAAGLTGELLADDQPAVASNVPVTSTVAPAPTVTVTVPTAPPSSTTLPRRTNTTVPQVAATFPTPPGLPPLPMPTVPRSPSASAWSKSANGITVRMHMEPATPLAGRPVTFVVDEVTAPVHCCVIHFSPELGALVPLPGANGPNPEMGICGSPPVTRTGLSHTHTHTFAEPGVYAIFLMVLTSPCQMPAGSGPSSAPEPSMLDLLGCVTVGPASAIRPETIPPRCTGP